MVQFKPYFLHVKEFDPAYIRIDHGSGCVRTNDIDIIGTTGRHLSFFEMLGNFSFGKYFKHEMCAWAYEFSTEVLELPKDRLYFTVFEDDDETIEIWKKLGVSEDHISRLGEDDNFWRAGPTGPCGPCPKSISTRVPISAAAALTALPDAIATASSSSGTASSPNTTVRKMARLRRLPDENIDTGMGLERMAAIMQGVQSNYETDVMRDLDFGRRAPERQGIQGKRRKRSFAAHYRRPQPQRYLHDCRWHPSFQRRSRIRFAPPASPRGHARAQARHRGRVEQLCPITSMPSCA